MYEVTGLSANPSLVAVGSNITFTATLIGGTNPPPLTWVVDGAVDTNSTGLTLTRSIATAGVKTVTVWCGPVSSNSITVTNVGVDAIEFYRVTSETVTETGTTNSGGVWEAASSPIYLLTGRTAQFRVRSSLAGAPWPTGTPVWSGTAGFSGTGETVSGAGSTLSTNLTDFKTIQVTCGNTSNLLNAIVFDFTNQFSPQLLDDFPGRSHDEYGIAELVDIVPVFNPTNVTAILAGGIDWSFDSLHFWDTNHPLEISRFFSTNSDAATFQAGGEGETVTIRATLSAGPSAFGMREKQLSIIEPTGAVLKPLKFAPGSTLDVVPNLAVYHRSNTISCLRDGLYFLVPTNVSFKGISAGEGGGKYTVSDIYVGYSLVSQENHPTNSTGVFRVSHLNGNPNYSN